MENSILFQVFSEATKRTAKNPIPPISQKRSEELRQENIQRLRNSAQCNDQITVQNNYDTPRSCFPNSRTSEEKEPKDLAAENQIVNNPNSMARHPSPRLPPSDKPIRKVDLSEIFRSR